MDVVARVARAAKAARGDDTFSKASLILLSFRICAQTIEKNNEEPSFQLTIYCFFI